MPPAPPIAPAKVWLVVSPNVSVLAPRATVLPATPASEPIVWLPPAAISKAAPAPATFTAPVGDRLPPAPTASVPALIVVPPVNVFVPVNVSVPEPCLTMPPVPPIAPPKVWLVASPNVSVLAPSATVPPEPPASEPMVCGPAAFEISKLAPDPATLTAPVDARLPPAPRANVPALIVVPPPKVFAPVSVSVPAPCLINAPAPLITPPNVWFVELPRVSEFAPNVTVLPDAPAREPMVCGPLAPEISKPAPMPAVFTALVDARLPPAPKASVPALIVAPPEKVFAAVNVSVPAPCLTMPPVPPITPPNT